ncbi:MULTISPECIES: hypothetical protein [Burkholderia cepacia complex]|uniref:Fis family transcriptional regulator n=1 Tax=Burkholderia pseudomultivorans TaxID=1207504 RepID=A0ABU2E1C8_9BURK|nr:MULTISPECIES: hypothetical protein [Burkholderia cepacia complex]MDN8069006.1 hypothetical protein [Burkholderia vietnamiensis]MDR8728277.1 hypothetical protein [Burkholderia pseudomultivorans]MDR8735245.1 hypothetical protein [Burkholderia pseudomultivorans]MDR8741379.1 hypothetical protein [Burkholderia pseudomultivorans]MDR8753667.1 hypothetical protein [Burkholderia pseudomultivorans]
MLLPLPASATSMCSLKFHACLTTVRVGFGNAEHPVELARVMYIAYLLQRKGYSTQPVERFHEAEDAMECVNRLGLETGTCRLDDAAYPRFAELMTLHDRQLADAPAHVIMAAEDELMRFIGSTALHPHRCRPRQVESQTAKA